MVIAAILTLVGWGVDSSLLYWAAGFGVNSMAYVLIALRDQIPDLLSVLLANMLIASTYAIFAYGLTKFLNRSISPLVIWAPVLIIFTAYPFLAQNVEARIIVGGMVNALQVALLLTLLIYNNSRVVGRGKYILMTAFLAGVVITLTRPVAVSAGFAEISAVNSQGLLQTLTFLPMMLINVAVALGLVLMQKEHAEAATSAIARLDELTGLPNRRSIYERISQSMLESEKKQTFGALLLIDLDNFKTVNDQYGHALGDDLLCQAADLIRECMTDKDTAARLGGDEFVVLLTELAEDRESAIEKAMQRAGQIRRKLDHDYQLNQEIVHCCSGSIGLAIFEPGMKDRETVLRQADQAMYRAKNNVKGSVGLDSSSIPFSGSANFIKDNA